METTLPTSPIARTLLWRVPAIQLLGSEFCGMAWGKDSCQPLVHVDPVSVQRPTSAWPPSWSWRGSGCPRRSGPGQGDPAARSPSMGQQRARTSEWSAVRNTSITARPRTLSAASCTLYPVSTFLYQIIRKSYIFITHIYNICVYIIIYRDTPAFIS